MARMSDAFANILGLLILAQAFCVHAGQDDNASKKSSKNCCLACQDAPQAIHPEPTVYPPECFTKCTYTVTKYTAAISQKCKCAPDQEAEALKMSKDRQEDDPPAEDPETDTQGASQTSQEADPPLLSDGNDSDTAAMSGAGTDDVNTRGRRSKDAKAGVTSRNSQDRIDELVFAAEPGPKALLRRSSGQTDDDDYNPDYGLMGSYEDYADKKFGVRARRSPAISIAFGSEEQSESQGEEVNFSPALMSRMRRGSKSMPSDCPENPFKICKTRPEVPECDEEAQDVVPNKCVGPCGRLGPGYLSAYGVNAKTCFRIIYRAKNLTYEVIFPSEIVDWENIDFDKYEKKRVTQIVRQKGGMEAIRKSTTFTGCNCEDLGNTANLQNDEGPGNKPEPTGHVMGSGGKEKRQMMEI